MKNLIERITSELSVLLGQAISDCKRAADMQMFGFGPRKERMNRKGEAVEVSEFSLHVQCRWRFVDPDRILFGRDDLNYPADENVSLDDFDFDKHESVLDSKRRTWFESHRSTLPKVTKATGTPYGGFRLELEGGLAIEAFPCDSRCGEYSEHWRLLGHHSDGSHFVVTGYGIEGE